ncbi:hypothetical protein ACTXT7_016185 [Hymenolepis weldensis]
MQMNANLRFWKSIAKQKNTVFLCEKGNQKALHHEAEIVTDEAQQEAFVSRVSESFVQKVFLHLEWPLDFHFPYTPFLFLSRQINAVNTPM